MKKALLLIAALAALRAGADTNTFRLAQRLLQENQPAPAAIEFRRFALEAEQPADRVQSTLYAAYSSLRADDPDAAERLLRQVENERPAGSALPILQAETAARRGDWKSALYFIDLLPGGETNAPLDTYAARRSAEWLVRSGDTGAARARLAAASEPQTEALQAVDAYAAGPRKSPVVGGLLGAIPGAGYWYSGEIANGFRSLLLNGLFLFGAYHTAQEEQWGAFGVIAFFELTWYSGSIYGGVDAAHRFNQEQMEQCIERINAPSAEPDPAITVPLFQFRFVFE